MKTVLVLGAGRSSASLISYLISEGKSNHWQVVVGDINLEAALSHVRNYPNAKAITFTIEDQVQRDQALQQADVVISLLPPAYHPLIAQHCLEKGKHLLTASYVSDEMKKLHSEALAKDLLFLNECGLDPGLDHMSAMRVIDRIKQLDGSLISFESFAGGLIAPETDIDNPWRYKFTWNPRNVVMAGQGTAKFLQNGSIKYISYQQLFTRTVPVHLAFGEFEGYANRDSLRYIHTYGLDNVETMLRGTLRYKGFSAAWNIFVQLGCCDDSYKMDNVAKMSHRDFLNAFLDDRTAGTVADKVVAQLDLDKDNTALKSLQWSGLFDDELIGLKEGTPAQILEHILNKKWKLNSSDRDMIVMWHRFIYKYNGVNKEIHSSLVIKGQDNVHTAMAMTVGLPLAIAAKLLLQDKIRQRGVIIPVIPELYAPILHELSKLGIEFIEKNIHE